MPILEGRALHPFLLIEIRLSVLELQNVGSPFSILAIERNYAPIFLPL
jgi:hypothetical protein